MVLGRDDGDRLDVWGRRRFVTEAEFRIVDPHTVQNCCEFATDRDTRARHSTTFGDLHAHARKAPFLAANEERMRRFVERRSRQFVATSADPPLKIRLVGLVASWGEPQMSADVPRFPEPLGLVDRRPERERRQWT